MSGAPIVGETSHYVLLKAPSRALAVLILGLSSRNWGPVRLPLNLTGAGATGCNLYVSMDNLSAVIAANDGAVSKPILLPNDNSLVGSTFHTQYMVRDARANGFGWTFTNGVHSTIGSAR